MEHPYKNFCILEQQMGMFNLQYENIKYWEIIRVYIIKKITKSSQTTIDLRERTSLVKLLFNNFRNVLIQKKLNRTYSKSDIVIVRPNCRYPEHIDTKEREFDFSGLEKNFSITNVYALGEYSHLNSLSLFDLSIPEFKVVLWKIGRQLFGTRIKISSEQNKKIVDFIELVNVTYKCDISIDGLIHQLQYLLAVHKIYSNYYGRILKMIDPNLIIFSTYYDDHIFPLCSCANDLGIKTIELQHGAINAHEAYWYENLNIEGKNLPDYLITYGEWWNKNIKMPNKEKVISVGYPFLESNIRHKKEKNSYTIAVFSGPEAGTVLSKFITDNIEILKENDINILYKLHPVEYSVWKREYKSLESCVGIEIIDDSRSVYDVLNQADMAFAVNTTVLFEATMYTNMKIGVYNKEFIAQMLPLINTGRARLINDIYDLLNFVKENQIDKQNENCEFYKMNAAKNMIYTTRKIMDGEI